MLRACHRENIRVAAYFNAGLDHEAALRYREWCTVSDEGRVYQFQNRRTKGYLDHWFRTMCFNTGYRDHLLAMIQEVLKKYPVDGLFLDSFNCNPCYGVECIDGMKKLGWDINDEAQVARYWQSVVETFADDVDRLVKKTRPGIYVTYNGLPASRQPRHLELEILPTGGWGYDFLPFYIRYARSLHKPFFTMTGRFHESWGDFGGLRPKQSLLFDCYNSLANGGTCSVGDHMHPRGRLEPAVYQMIGEVYAETQKLDPWTQGALPLTEIAVVFPKIKDYWFRFEKSAPTLQGISRMLMELKYQFDIVDGDGDLSKYRVLILPDEVTLDERLSRILAKHAKASGIIISSGVSGLDPEKSAFVLPEYKIDYLGPEPYNTSFFQAKKEISRDLPDMLNTIYTAGIAMKAKKGAIVLAELHQPYFNKYSWDWHHENTYIPPEKPSGRAALVQCGNILHFSFPIFRDYFEHALAAYKYLVRNGLERVWPRPLVKMKGMPSFGQVTLAQQNKRRMVHLLTYVPELRGKQIQVIEEPIIARDVEVRLRKDKLKLKSAYLAPSQEPLELLIDDGYWHVTVPQVKGYQMVVFESV